MNDRLRDCPKCGAALTGSVCNVCGEGKPVSRKGEGKSVERRKEVEINGHMFNLLLCQHIDRGQECAGIAVYSPSTTGGGPWFCRKHDPTRSDSGKRTPPPQGFRAFREFVERVESDDEIPF